MTQSTGRTAHLLNAYRDRELSGFARWRFERRLRRSPELQRELAALARIGDWVRASHEEPSGADLWERIALRLPAIDARRAEAPASGRRGLGWLALPGAFASVVLVAVFAFQWLVPPTPNRIGVVRWLDSGPRDVMVLEAAPDTTIVWVIGAPGKRPGERMKTSSRIRARFALGLALAGLVPLSPVRTAVAQASDRVPVNVIVVHTSDGEGGVDPRARELDEKLKGQLRYKSMRVLQEERVDLEMNQVGTVELPDGRKVRMRPMHKGAKGVLMAVDVQGAVKLDARARNHHKVVIGAGEYQDGNLAVSIEPDYQD